jgi:hypothetical protein
MRLRLLFTHWGSPAFRLTDTPRPDCPKCKGAGGWPVDVPDASQEFADTEHQACDCWKPARHWRVTPVPRWIARRFLGWREQVFSDEPPF